MDDSEKKFVEEFAENAALMEARIGKIFALAGMLRFTPIEMIAAAQFFMAYGTFQLRCDPTDPYVEASIGRVTSAMLELHNRDVRFDPILWAKNLAHDVIKGSVQPPITLATDADLEPLPTVKLPAKPSGWNTPV